MVRANHTIIDDTVYRVGSISKLLLLYTFLVEAGHDYWHRPITDFIPELVEAAESCSAEADPLTCPDWDEITLGALASHLAGLGRGRPVTPAPTAIGGVPVTSLGLPPKPVIELAQCEKQPCTRAESIRAFLQEAPVEASFSTPIYSNGAYQILTYALEAITNRTMSDMITDDVFCPLEMDDSSYSLKANASGIIPNSTNSFWNVPLGDAGATGGVYSSARDMVKLGQAILNNTQLSPSSTRKWFKPWAHTAVWQQAVGLAWEIARWPVDDRIVDVYTKQGDLGMLRIFMHTTEQCSLTFSAGLYHSRFAIIPDYDIGVLVLTAGSGDAPAQSALFETVLTDLIPGLDATARSQAETNLAGIYASSDPEVNTTLTLTTEPSLPGLKLTSFVSNSTDVLHTLFAGLRKSPNPDVRLYPTELVRKNADGTQTRKYNIVANSPDVKYPDSLVEALNCVSWQLVDSTVYGAIGIDEVWIETDDSGKAVGVEVRAFGAKMEKVE